MKKIYSVFLLVILLIMFGVVAVHVANGRSPSCSVSASVECCSDSDCPNGRCIINNDNPVGNYCATNYNVPGVSSGDSGSGSTALPSTAGCDAGTLVENSSGVWSCTHQYNAIGIGGITQTIYPCDLNGGCGSKPGDGYAFPYYDHDAALAEALKDGCTGVQQVNVSPLVNPNGLNYYYTAVGCPSGTTSGGNSGTTGSTGGTTGVTGSGGTTNTGLDLHVSQTARAQHNNCKS